jgi:hypothetical protein
MSLIDPKLAEILVCPVDHGELIQHQERSELECQDCGRVYPVRDGIPIMLVKDDPE